MKQRQQSIIGTGIVLLCISSLASAQLTYQIDANTNSFTIQTPNSQQTFTRYFNGGNGAAPATRAATPIQSAQSQPQQQVCISIEFTLFFKHRYLQRHAFFNIIYSHKYSLLNRQNTKQKTVVTECPKKVEMK